MTHLVVVDYPYFTLKKFFGSLEEARNFTPKSNPYKHYYRLLNKNIFELKDYMNDLKYNINFDIKIK